MLIKYHRWFITKYTLPFKKGNNLYKLHRMGGFLIFSLRQMKISIFLCDQIRKMPLCYAREYSHGDPSPSIRVYVVLKPPLTVWRNRAFCGRSCNLLTDINWGIEHSSDVDVGPLQYRTPRNCAIMTSRPGRQSICEGNVLFHLAWTKCWTNHRVAVDLRGQDTH